MYHQRINVPHDISYCLFALSNEMHVLKAYFTGRVVFGNKNLLVYNQIRIAQAKDVFLIKRNRLLIVFDSLQRK